MVADAGAVPTAECIAGGKRRAAQLEAELSPAIYAKLGHYGRQKLL
jgi:hypothetical protein